ncbi:Uncharacterized protein DAT39_020300, partial [Clarias magur]
MGFCLCLKALAALKSLSTSVPIRTSSLVVATVLRSRLAMRGLQFLSVACRHPWFPPQAEGTILKDKVPYALVRMLDPLPQAFLSLNFMVL